MNGSQAGASGAASMASGEVNANSESAGTDTSVVTVELSLTRLHDCIERRRADSIAAARRRWPDVQLPRNTTISNGSMQIKIPFPDLLSTIDDVAASPLAALENPGTVELDPQTITPDGLTLLHAAFKSRCLIFGEDKAVHLLHISIQLGIESLFVCMDEQPEAYVTDTNFLALMTCLFDHFRTQCRLLQFCLHRLHSLWPRLVQKCAKHLRQLLDSCSAAPFSDVLVDAFKLCADPRFGGCCNARAGYGMLLHLLRRDHRPVQCKEFRSAVNRISNLPHKPLILLPYLFAKQLTPCGQTCAECHAFLLHSLLKTKCTPQATGVVTEIHSSTHSCVVVWRVPRFKTLTSPKFSFDFRTPQNRVLHMRMDPQGFGRGQGTHLSLFIKESVPLQQDVNCHFVFGVTSTTQDAYVKPMSNCTLSQSRKEYTGRQQFMALDMLKRNSYLEPDGSLMVMLEVVELPAEQSSGSTSLDGDMARLKVQNGVNDGRERERQGEGQRARDRDTESGR